MFNNLIMKKTEENSEDLYACFNNNTSLIFVECFIPFSNG